MAVESSLGTDALPNRLIPAISVITLLSTTQMLCYVLNHAVRITVKALGEVHPDADVAGEHFDKFQKTARFPEAVVLDELVMPS